MYHNGIGVEQNDEKAVYWHRKAAEQGDAEGQFSLGWLYYQGIGVKKDYKKASEWFGKAADQGLTEAQAKLKELEEQLQKNTKPLLIIDKYGTLTGLTDKTKLQGKLILPAEVKKIGENAFYDCKGLTEIDFSACTNLVDIGRWAFFGCTGLTEVRLPASLTKIGYWAFDECTGLTEVRLPARLTEIGKGAFAACRNLHRLIVAPENTSYYSKDNVIYTKNMKKLICAAGGITQISIPDTVTQIEGWAFDGCTGLTEVRMPASLTEIGEWAFSGCTGLTKLDISACKNLTKIGEQAFYGCKNLEDD